MLDSIGSLFGFKKAPERFIAPLDEGTKGMIQDLSQEGFKDEDYFKQQQLQGVGEDFKSTQQTPEQFKTQEESGFAMNPFFSNAIHEKYQQEASKELDRIKTQSDYQGKLMKGYELRRSMSLALAQNNVAIRNMQALAQARMNAEQMRSQVLSSLFGAAGNIAGVYMHKKFRSGPDMNVETPYQVNQQNLQALSPGQANINEGWGVF